MIYLDNNATTRPGPGVVAAMNAALTQFWPNPSSIHRPGQAARQQVELARRDVGTLINAPAREITFTSGGTEAIHLAIRGVLGTAARRTSSGGTPALPVVVTPRTEHAAVRELLEDLQKRGGADIRWAPVGRDGLIDPAALGPLLAGAALASIQWANNETGAIQPVAAIADLCRRHRAVFHCDATQWAGKMPCDAPAGGADLLTFAPHKFHGPKGVGILWARRGLAIAPPMPGSQELGRRGGTENVPGILGAGAACREAAVWLADPGGRERLASLRDRFERTIVEALPGAVINGPADPALRLWNTTNIGFPRLEAEALLLLLSEQGVCASAGAACSSGSLDPSPVLLAMGIPEPIAHGSLRFSLSRDTTGAEIEEAAAVVISAVRRLGQTLPIGSPSRTPGAA